MGWQRINGKTAPVERQRPGWWYVYFTRCKGQVSDTCIEDRNWTTMRMGAQCRTHAVATWSRCQTKTTAARLPASPLFIFFSVLLTYFSSKPHMIIVYNKDTNVALLLCPTLTWTWPHALLNIARVQDFTITSPARKTKSNVHNNLGNNAWHTENLWLVLGYR